MIVHGEFQERKLGVLHMYSRLLTGLTIRPVHGHSLVRSNVCSGTDPSRHGVSITRTELRALLTAVIHRAAADGWPCVILSDMLLLRNWTNPEAYRADDASASGSAAPVAPPADSLASLVSPVVLKS